MKTCTCSYWICKHSHTIAQTIHTRTISTQHTEDYYPIHWKLIYAADALSTAGLTEVNDLHSKVVVQSTSDEVPR